MRLVFITGAVIGIGAAAFFFFRRQLDAAFLAATIGVVSGFLSYRVKMKQLVDELDKTDSDMGEELNEDANN